MSYDVANWIWVLHGLAVFYMTGLIWFVQRVHYPLMRHVPPADYPVFQQRHIRRTTAVVAPVMTLEMVTAVALLFIRPPLLSWPAALVNLALLLLIWLSSATLQVPCHRRLGDGFDAGAHELLVRSNWIRTVLWTARAVLLLSLMVA